MSVVGIVSAKAKSSRFPGKNRHLINGYPMFYWNVKALKECEGIDDVYVSTDCPEIKSFCVSKGIPIIHRGPNAVDPEMPLLEITKYAYMNLPKHYDVIATILANGLNHTSEDVRKAIVLQAEKDLWEVRSYSESDNVENGILILTRKALMMKSEVSWYCGAIMTEGKEIHKIGEIEDA